MVDMIVPRVGDYWEFYPTVGKKHKTKKHIQRIYWSLNKDGKNCPWIEWSHTPSARYLGDVRVKYFLAKKAVRLISRARIEPPKND